MKFFSTNIEHLRLISKLTQAEIQARTGVERTSWSNYERGKSFPNLKLFHEIALFFGISESDLLNKDLRNVAHPTAHPTAHPNKKKGVASPSASPTISEPPTDYSGNTFQNKPNVYELNTRAAAGIPVILDNKDRQNQLEMIYLPNLGSGLHIRAQISGDSMHPTVKDTDSVVATQLPEPNTGIREGVVYVVLDKDDGLVCKRVYKAGDNELELVSDNEIYKPYKRHLKDIQAIFKVRQVHSSDLHNYSYENRAELNKVWAAIDEIRHRLP